MTTIAQVEGTHPYHLGADTLIGVDEQGSRWSINYRGKNAILVATFDGGATLEFKIPTSSVNKTGSVAAFTIPNFGDAQWVTHAEHVKFEVRFPTPPKVSEVSLNIARQSCTVVSDGQGGLDVFSGDVKVGALPRPWIEYVPDGSEDTTRLDLDWVVAEPQMSLTMPTLTASEWATAVLDPTVITTSTAAAATAYSNQRKIDRTQNGVLWAMYWDGTSNTTDSMHFRYSTDDGATWSDGGGFGFAGTGTGYTPDGSLFIDLDDCAHVVYRDRSAGAPRYRRGTPNAARTAWTWSADQSISSNTASACGDIVAHREGAGWAVHMVTTETTGASYNAAYYHRATIASDGGFTFGGRTTLASYANAPHTYPSIDFHHTGDGKTVKDGTPHLYVAWSAGATGTGKGIRFKKATYSGGSWTWGTEREIDSTSYANGGRISSVFDGTRVAIAYADSASTSSVKIRERDAADTTTTTRTPTSLSDGVVTGLSVSYDDLGNLFLGAVGTTSDDVKSLKYDRTAGTWGTWETVATATAGADTLSLERGYSENAIAALYTDGTSSPYSVTFDSIVLTVPPNTGTASGSVTNTGSAVGTRESRGTASGSVSIAGSATGTAPVIPPNTGTATGTITFTGSARGGSGGVAVGAITISGAATGFAPDVFYVFTPPTHKVANPSAPKPFRFYGQLVSSSVVFRNGRYQEVRSPLQEEVAALEEGVTWFPGGRSFTVDDETRLLLEADGFTVDFA